MKLPAVVTSSWLSTDEAIRCIVVVENLTVMPVSEVELEC